MRRITQAFVLPLAQRLQAGIICAICVVFAGCSADRFTDESDNTDLLSGYVVSRSYELKYDMILIKIQDKGAPPFAIVPDMRNATEMRKYNAPERVDNLGHDPLDGRAYTVITEPIDVLRAGTKIQFKSLQLKVISSWFYGKAGETIPEATILGGIFNETLVSIADISIPKRINLTGLDVLIYGPNPELVRQIQ